MEFTVIGDAVNRAACYCGGAPPGDGRLSPEMYTRVWSIVQALPTTIATKHEWDLKAYRIERLKA
jgi:hypothetical protein